MSLPPDPSQSSSGSSGSSGHPPELLRIGEFARVAGTNLRTLRYYEELELLVPFSRSKGGFRHYRVTDVNRLKMIRGLQELGLSLDRIRELMATREAGLDRAELMERVRDALAEQDRLLEERIGAIQDQRSRIRDAQAKLAQCEPCEHTPEKDNNHCEPCAFDGLRLPDPLSALF